MNERNSLKTFIETELLSGTDNNLNYDDDLLLSGLVNSLGIMRLLTYIETEFNITVPMEDVIIENFQTIDAIANYLQVHSK